jgi:hypothetical protein
MADKARVAIYANAPHQLLWGRAFGQGLVKHGIEPNYYSGGNHPHGHDVVVFWSARRRQLIANQKAARRHYIILERGYFGNREAMTSAGWNGLNGRADFRNAGMPADRWKKHGLPIAEWGKGEYALILGQVPGDMSHAHANIDAWYSRMVEEWGALMPVRFRHHPGGEWTGVRNHSVTVLRNSLEEALANAAIAVTFNSTAGVNSLLAGVPVYAEDEGSMVYKVASHTVGQIMYPNRQQWAHDLAYCQWTVDEMASGETWEHLKHGTEFD